VATRGRNRCATPGRRGTSWNCGSGWPGGRSSLASRDDADRSSGGDDQRLCTGGGAIGVAIGFAVASVVAHGANWPVVFDPAMAAGAVVFSGLIGVIFGYYPAKRAASLDPVAALRGD